ncbi:hypothetical protein NE237_022459 [Protea cynaroides]|uniref:Uncharacterized protein n=1 Tax=Protea cynaroides TaxID=273540 RepID=A0A9Q0HB13_9MAGN|nr:hypothetical protein NE237_022459 [Protea cynaroides]
MKVLGSNNCHQWIHIGTCRCSCRTHVGTCHPSEDDPSVLMLELADARGLGGGEDTERVRGRDLDVVDPHEFKGVMECFMGGGSLAMMDLSPVAMISLPMAMRLIRVW